MRAILPLNHRAYDTLKSNSPNNIVAISTTIWRKFRRWGTDTKPAHLEPPTTSLIKITSTGKSEEDYVKLNLCRDSTSSTSDRY